MKPEYSGGTRVTADGESGLAWSIDLLVATLSLVVAGAVVMAAPPTLSDAVRVLLTLPIVLLLPGYALLAAAFPTAGPRHDAQLGESRARWRAPTPRERLAIAPGLSLLLIPLFSVVSSVVLGRFDPRVVVGSLAAFVVIGCVVAAVRRGRVPVDERFALPVERWLRARWFDTSRPRDLVATLLLAVCVVAAVGVVGYAAADPTGSPAYTDMYLATQSGDDYTIGNYPQTLVVGEPASLHVGLENNEGRRTTYSVVVLAQRVDTSGSEPRVLAQRELDRAGATVAAGETAYLETVVTPTRLGTDIRLTYLLYRGQPADTLSTTTAYRHTYIWVDVVESERDG